MSSIGHYVQVQCCITVVREQCRIGEQLGQQSMNAKHLT